MKRDPPAQGVRDDEFVEQGAVDGLPVHALAGDVQPAVAAVRPLRQLHPQGRVQQLRTGT